jgi:hypothetical protein
VQTDRDRFLLALLLVVIAFLLYLLLATIYGWPPFNNADNSPIAVQSYPAPPDDDLSLPTVSTQAASSEYPVSDRFRGFYEANGGLAVLGLPISVPLVSNGREFQWFERARLEYWPEHAGTPYEVQLGRLGAEYTTGIAFPGHPYLVSTPERVYFRETGHSVSGGFLRFWESRGGLRVFGYPISDELRERIDGQVYTVQYFERARFEYHQQNTGTPYDVQLGLLGRALYLAESRPDIQP